MAIVTMLRGVLDTLGTWYRYKRLIEHDGSHLIEKYGSRAVTRALEFDAQGAVHLDDDRREGHWGRVARCISGRPLPVRSRAIFG